MNIQNKIKIGEHFYNIKKVRILDWKNKNVVGNINYATKLMKLKKLGPDKRIYQDTFFHEVAHGILKELEFNYPRMQKFRNDECFVQELGLNLRKTFIDLLENQEKE